LEIGHHRLLGEMAQCHTHMRQILLGYIFLDQLAQLLQLKKSQNQSQSHQSQGLGHMD
jgi:hypothetical protein